jgi:hypothetical protein
MALIMLTNMRKQLCARRWVCVTVVLMFATATHVWAGTLDGFVTSKRSPTDFYLGALHVVTNQKSKCGTQDISSDIYLKEKVYALLFAHRYFDLRSHAVASSRRNTRCDQLPIFVGSRVRIIGHRNGSSVLFAADSVVLYTAIFRQTFSSVYTHDNPQSAALLEENPKVDRVAKGWSGTLWIDGYPATITPDTNALELANGAQIVYQPFGLFSDARLGPKRARSAKPILSKNEWRANTWVAYRRFQSTTGSVGLSRIVVWPNQVSAGEAKFRLQHSRSANGPDRTDCLTGSNARRATDTGSVEPAIPTANLQAFVSKIGQSLVPDYQRTLPTNDPTKITFRFCIVQTAAGRSKDVEMFKGMPLLPVDPIAANVITALPDGQIFISDVTLAHLGNAAELGFLLSDVITSVLQKHAYIAQNARPDAVINSDFQDFSRFRMILAMHQQSLRIGIRQMYLAGYDIREAPFAWAVAQGKPVANPVIDSKHPDKEIPWYAAYAFNYISQYYKDVDYSKLKRGRREYQQFLQELYKADPSLLRPEAKD